MILLISIYVIISIAAKTNSCKTAKRLLETYSFYNREPLTINPEP